ncbi:LysM peptidoglycan-binding domain-containing protein [Isoptericola sp. NPDC057191]|uniref:LysM peptidoglycan-binding domain-containing protein n=1 Tax=Isoptericola sp. NPDC057191 TaxID=3346041 RepID=UPI003624CBF7
MSSSSEPARHGVRSSGLGRLGLLSFAAGVVAIALTVRAASLAPRSTSAAGSLTVDRWVELGVLGAGLATAAWLALSGALALACVGASLLGRRWRAGESAVDRLAPLVVRRLVRSAVGAGVGAGLALAPAAALAADDTADGPTPGESTVVLDLGWQPTSDVPPAAVSEQDRAGSAGADPAAAPVARAPTSREGTATGVGSRVVLRGDTLWAIARDRLGGTPSDAETLREVTRWHETNRDVIGPDPDRILPGQILRAPA